MRPSPSRRLLPLAPTLLLAACAASEAEVQRDGASGPGRPPHVLMVMVDDLGWRDLEVPAGSPPLPAPPGLRTPNALRLAAEGVVFTRAYASAPVCTPTRVAWMTGLDPAATGVTWWTLRADADVSTEHPTLAPPAWRVNGLGEEDVTLAGLLRDAGYATIHVGKAHLGADGTPGADPTRLGFEVSVAGHAAGAPGSYLGEDRYQNDRRRGRAEPAPSIWDVPDLEAYHDTDTYLTEALAEEAVAALRRAHASGRPVFLNFCPYAVHTPLQANPRHLRQAADLPPVEAAYASMVASVDAALGRLLDELERLDMVRDTLVLLTSDNGGLSAHTRAAPLHVHNAPLRSGKGSALEGGLRVPLVVRWPGRARAGGRSARPVVTTDLTATVLWAAGIDHPTHGEPLQAALRRPDELHGRGPIGWHVPHQWGAPGPGIEPFSAWMRGPHKLIWYHASGRLVLYDVERDPGETLDLSSERPGLRRELLAELTAWLEDRGAGYSRRRPGGGAVRPPAPRPPRRGARPAEPEAG